mgnify:FL=1
MKRILSTLLVFALAIPLFVNCKKDKGVPVESFSIDPVTVYLNDGDTHQLDVIVQPKKAKKGEFMSSLVWVSDDENIASVDENGLVTAKMRGNTRITASTSDGTLSASCDVNVQLVLTDDKDITAYFEGNFALALRYKGLIADENKITYGDVKDIKEFDVPALYVKDIETAGGLEFLVNLESLDLGGAKNLTSLNVSTLTKLKKLVAAKGKLTHVDLTNCSDLESVFMDDNKLESVVFGQHPNLTKVSMNTNKLKEFNASSLPGLVYLDLAENELESIDLTGCKLIETLWLNNNKLKSIDAGSLEKLQLQGFRFFFNPGENGVLNVKDSKNSMSLWSWQMIKGDESSRVKGTLYCENSPKIKTQPKSEIAAKTGVPFSVSVEMESSGNYQYMWVMSTPIADESTGLTSYAISAPLSDDSDGSYYISGSNTNTLTINVGSSNIFVLLACMIYDEATGTTTISDFASIKYE